MFLHSDFDDTHRELFHTVQAWAKKTLAPGAAERDRDASFDEALYRRLDTELGLMNITLPESLGGSELDVAATILAIEALSEQDPGIAMSYLSQELLFAHQLYWSWHFSGRNMPERHKTILKNKWISGMAMTEPNAGTDVLGMSTTASRTEDGFVLNGVKQWITNAPVGKAFLVYARTGEARRDISLFMVEAGIPGFSCSECEHKMGMRSSPTGILTFQDCRIPETSLVAEFNGGLVPMIRNLAIERLGLAAQSCGIASTCFEEMRRYAIERHAFGKSIVEFGQIQRLLSESYASLLAMHTMLYTTIRQVMDNDPESSVNADAVKLFCATAAETISRNAIQILGANGYSTAYPVERLHRDSVLLSIGGGTNEALQKNISRQLIRRKEGLAWT